MVGPMVAPSYGVLSSVEKKSETSVLGASLVKIASILPGDRRSRTMSSEGGLFEPRHVLQQTTIYAWAYVSIN